VWEGCLEEVITQADFFFFFGVLIQGLAGKPRLAFDSPSSCLLSAGITGRYHHPSAPSRSLK
jgi:hypothetical protein